MKRFLYNRGLGGEGGYLEVLRISYPLIIMSASHTVMQFCDRKFLGMNSQLDVAAALPAGILTFTLFSFFMVNVNFTSALVAQYYGKHDVKSCIRVTWNGFYFALASAAVILTVVPWIGIGAISISGHDPEILQREMVYYKTLIPSGAFVCLSGAFCSFFSGMGRTWYVTLINIGSCLINILLDYAMIFGEWGFPAMGIAGAGIATSIAAAFAFVASFLCFIFQRQRRLPTRSLARFCFDDIRRLLKFGSPAGLQCFLSVGAFAVSSFLIGWISREAMAVTTIAMAVNMISFLPLLGLSDGTAILVGQYIGGNRHDIAELLTYRSWRLAALYMALAGTVFLVFPDFLIRQFAAADTEPEVLASMIATGGAILACAAVYNFFDATKFVFMGALRGSGDTRVLMIICICCAWTILVPGVFALIVLFKTGIVAVWIFMSFYLGVESLLIYRRFRAAHWRKIKMTGPAVPLECMVEAGQPVPAE